MAARACKMAWKVDFCKAIQRHGTVCHFGHEAISWVAEIRQPISEVDCIVHCTRIVSFAAFLHPSLIGCWWLYSATGHQWYLESVTRMMNVYKCNALEVSICVSLDRDVCSYGWRMADFCTASFISTNRLWRDVLSNRVFISSLQLSLLLRNFVQNYLFSKTYF